MEALVALGLASNVIQFVDVGSRAVSTCWQIHKEGATVDHKSLQATANSLSSIGARLEGSLRDARTSQAPTESESALIELARRCVSTASEVQGLLEGILKHSKHGFRASVRKTVSSLRRTRTIEDLKMQLAADQRLLDTSLLSSLHESARHIVSDQLLLQERLDDADRSIIAKLASGVSRVCDLVSAEGKQSRRLITTEGELTRGHITRELRDLTISSSVKSQRTEFLESLHFPELSLRQEQVKPAYAETFEFIFDESGEHLRPWSNFVEWLRSDRDIYWINGKAGSGKSTLLGFISEDCRTTEHLFANTKTSSKPMLVSFFFWNAGTKLQKSAEGLLRSILYQLIDSDPTLYNCLELHDPNFQQRSPRTAWSVKALTDVMLTLMTHMESPLCLVLDGLDEFDDHLTDLVDIVENLRGQPRVKLCLSSRPLRTLERAFEGDDNLKLQDLTRRSIEIYVNATLGQNQQFQCFQEQQADDDLTQRKELVSMILDKAQGVFLWVKLAILSLLDGVDNLDDWESLLERLNEIPDELEKFYLRMWSKMQKQIPRYKEDARRSFRLILDKALSLLEFTITTDEHIQSTYLVRNDRIRDEEIVRRCQERQVHLLARCAGFLEISAADRNLDPKAPLSKPVPDVDESHFSAAEQLRLLHSRATVNFLHRTAADFVRKQFDAENPPNGTHMYLGRGEQSDLEIRLRCVLWRMDPDASRNIDLRRELALLTRFRGSRVSIETFCMARETFEPLLRKQMKESGNVRFGHSAIGTDFLGAALEVCVYPAMMDGVLDVSTPEPDYPSYLLACVCAIPPDFIYIVHPVPADLICSLLDRGAHPMASVHVWGGAFVAHPWALFLQQLWERTRIFSTLTGPFVDESSTAALTKFVSSGASLECTALFITAWASEYGLKARVYEDEAVVVLFTSGARNFLDRLGVSTLLETGNDDSHGSLDAQHEFQVALVRLAENEPWRRPLSIEDSRIILDILASMEGPNEEQKLSTNIAAAPSVSHWLDLDRAWRKNNAPPKIREIASRTYEITDDSPQEDRIIPCWNHETLPILGFFLETDPSAIHPSLPTLDNVGERLKLPRWLWDIPT